MGFSYGIGIKEKWQAKGMCQLQSFKQKLKKTDTFCNFVKKFWKR
jgi:hypothetical protein